MALKRRSSWIRWYTPLAVALVVLVLLICSLSQSHVRGYALQHSTVKLQAAPVTAGDLEPFLNLVPSQDGTALFISAGGMGKPAGTLFVSVGGLGPGHEKDSWTMTYSETARAYVATAVGFVPQTGASGPINITSTLGLDTGVVEFNRAYVPASTIQMISSIDGKLELSIVSTDTLPSETYVAVVPSYAPPGPAPVGHRIVGSTYSVRAAGALLTADRPMSLRMYYDETTLAGADLHTLSIFAWDAYRERWEKLGGRLFYDQQYLSVPTSRFTTYALMATPSWRDDFDDFSGLDETDNVTVGGASEEWTLVLSEAPGEGVAVSQAITPTAAFVGWSTLIFTATTDPPITTLSVDVLDVNGTEVLTDVTSGIDLTVLDPARHPVLRLRANLSSTAEGATPALKAWQLSWQVEEHKVYLPMVLR